MKYEKIMMTININSGFLTNTEYLSKSIDKVGAAHYQGLMRLVKIIKPIRIRWIMVYRWLGAEYIS